MQPFLLPSPPPASTSRCHPNRSLVICRHRSCFVRTHPVQHSALHFTLFQQQVPVPPWIPKRFGGGNPLSDGPAIPPRSFQFATFNARRLWERDQSAHDGFHMLSGILSAEGVDVLCIQEVFAGDFPRLPVNQPYSYDGPSESSGRFPCAQWSLFCRSPRSS